MAKGNMLLGYSRGSVGDVVFYRDGGSQRQRARNRQPNNPNTEPQVKQRSKFANAVKFFKQVNSSFFKFAFEDKKTNESDYNAFMRHNVARSGYIGAAANKIANWPALGLWQMSDGSLPKISAPFPQPVSTALSFSMGDGIAFPNASSVGAVSSSLVSSPNWREGDIVTFVAYAVTPSAGLPTIDTESTAYAASFGFAQFIVNSNDTSALPTLSVGGFSFNIDATAEGGSYLGLVAASQFDSVPLIGACVIHSRNSSSGLLVSPSELSWVDFDTSSGVVISETPVAAMATNSAYYQQVIADWQAAALAVLQGGAARGGSVEFSARLSFANREQQIEIPSAVSLSVSGGSAEGVYVYFSGTNWAQGDVSVAATGQTATGIFYPSEQYVYAEFSSGGSAVDAAAGTVLTITTPRGNVVITFVA